MATNYITEWFGHIVWPPGEVDGSSSAMNAQRRQLCPFMGAALGTEVLCSKTHRSLDTTDRTGFCTQSSESGGRAEDWLACPKRVLGTRFDVLSDSARYLYGLKPHQEPIAIPVSRLAIANEDGSLEAHLLNEDARVFAFSMNPPALGGEIDIRATRYSPASKVDVTIFEVEGLDRAGAPVFGCGSIFEIQTADFHGSPIHAINQLRAMGPPTVGQGYHQQIAANPDALSKKVEGPNKANIFKRTIYQMLLKIRMARAGDVGFCLVLPEPVWRSWAVHLGNAVAVPSNTEGVHVLRAAGGAMRRSGEPVPAKPAWIIVFKIDRDSRESPRPLHVVQRIATTADELATYAFESAPDLGVAEGALDSYRDAFLARADRYRN